MAETQVLNLRRLRRAPHLCAEQTQVTYHEFELDLEVGLGMAVPHPPPHDPGPQVMLRWSDDGGVTWSHEHWLSAGVAGAYDQRLVWRRLGRGRDRVFELTMSDPVAWRLVNAFIRASAGRH